MGGRLRRERPRDGTVRGGVPSGLPDARWTQGFALAQVTALLSASSAVASTALVERGANLPAWQSFFIYVSSRRSTCRPSGEPARATATDARAPRRSPRLPRPVRSMTVRPRIFRVGAVRPVAKSGGHVGDLFDDALRGAGAHRHAGELSDREGVSVHLPDESPCWTARNPGWRALSRAALGGVCSRRHVLGGATRDGSRDPRPDGCVRARSERRGSNPALGDFIALLAASGTPRPTCFRKRRF